MKMTMSLFKNIMQCMALEYKNELDWYKTSRGYSFDQPYGEGKPFSAFPDCGHFYEIDHETALIAIMGTHNGAGWISNFDADRVEAFYAMMPRVPITNKIETDVLVHDGFSRGWKAMRGQVYTLVAPYKRVIFTAHSRGSAIAQIGAENLCFDCPEKEVWCLPFSSPKAGNEAFVKLYTERVAYSLRVSYANDPVPGVPLKIEGYANVPQEIHLTAPIWRVLDWLLPINPNAHFPENLLREAPKQLVGIIPVV